MGKARTEKKVAASRVNASRAAESRRGVPVSDEHKAKLKAAQQARREREKQERAALGIAPAIVEKKKTGRPAKVKPEQDSAAEKRPRGRPKRQDAQLTAQGLGTPETGAQGQESLLQERNGGQ